MLVLERQKMILSQLKERGSVRVSILASEFNVTEETVRRDLDKLEEKGMLTRSHGGAVAVKEPQKEIPYWFREIAQEREKAVIAHSAIERIVEGDRIILDASTTAWHIAKRLRDMDLTVVTNSIRVAVALSEFEKIDVISVGGQLSKRSLSYVGPQAEDNMRSYHVDKLFLSCAGVDLERGLSDLSAEQASMRRCMLNQADTLYLLADHSKIGVKALSVIGDFEMFDEVITDGSAPESFIAAIRKNGTRVHVVNDQDNSIRGV